MGEDLYFWLLIVIIIPIITIDYQLLSQHAAGSKAGEDLYFGLFIVIIILIITIGHQLLSQHAAGSIAGA